MPRPKVEINMGGGRIAEHDNTTSTERDTTSNEEMHVHDATTVPIMTPILEPAARDDASKGDTIFVSLHDGASYVLPYASWQASL